MWTNNFNINLFFIWEKYIRKHSQKAKYSEISFFDSMLLAYNYQNWAESHKNITLAKMHTFLNTTKKFEEFFHEKDIQIGDHNNSPRANLIWRDSTVTNLFY